MTFFSLCKNVSVIFMNCVNLIKSVPQGLRTAFVCCFDETRNSLLQSKCETIERCQTNLNRTNKI